jgi:RNA polymerase sigma-70 factor (ECF subfamily)
VEHFGKLLVEQIPRLRRYARALTGDSHLAEDLVQDSLGRAWSRMQQWQPDSNLRAWLFTIMHNLHVNNLRRDRHQYGWEANDGKELADTRLQGQERAMTLQDLEQGLARLPADQREVLMLVCVEGMSYQQVADILGMPAGTVMSRLHRARARMRLWMHGEEPPKLRRVK